MCVKCIQSEEGYSSRARCEKYVAAKVTELKKDWTLGVRDNEGDFQISD